MKILIIEDNRDIHDNIVEFLKLKGHHVEGALDGLTGLHLAASKDFDAIILDIMLPGADGYHICRTLRQHAHSNAAILILTARDELSDRLVGFEVGADDYVVKPFAMAEVVVRLETIVARRRGRNPRILQVSDLRYDLDTLEVTRAGHPVRLTPTGLKLLEVLMRRSPAVVSKRVLEDAVWGRDLPRNDIIKSNIYLIRRAIDKGFEQPLVHTLHGLGYKLSSP
ncbi:response regulator transcription factor [Pseudomonas typographi]|uniref:Response regulator transcription factor n=1 Tax=Pseudomonas typographi TaxID=2715964 RepID=A0ABR7Z0Z4_9PSED|nr:response regulator transcription factor [Pseudomonas typographi]MBD1587333.1 response regulator transcription factor [Pseudomonas typographi]MBD1599171.1 response regulator transcription factor [Pseudomonas typographi]